jgi:hypothetical protein
MKKFIIFISLIICSSVSANDIEKYVQDMHAHTGFYNFYWDDDEAKIYLEISEFNQEFLYVNYLQTGVGSNDIGLDRGQIGDNRVVHFERHGPKILLVQPNQTYRAISDNPQERQAVEDGFARSVLWGTTVVAEQDGSVLVDVTDFLLEDSHHIKSRLKQLNEGQFSVDKSRSVLHQPNSGSFPDNTEFEAIITLSGINAGKHLRSVAPDNTAVTVRTHHSFVRLPEDIMQPRIYDPRSGGIPLTFYDYAAPLGESMKVQWAIRHRINTDDNGTVIKPITYYLDSGTPEPMRSALLDGARWWQTAFEAAGLKNAFEVKMLPNDVNPLDIRYNTIQWVHRSTRGWSYGYSIVDPRSGEILKGHVTLGSLRVRQDMRIAQALLSPFTDTNSDTSAIKNMALARLRQLSAHEVGHTLGLIHNFHASSQNRNSVMDYPHPLVQIKGGDIDLSQAYEAGIGSWDKLVVNYLYRKFKPNQNKAAELQKIIADGQQSGHTLIADRDARAKGGAHPQAHLWDNGSDAVTSLYQVLEVRQNALQKFGLNSLPEGTAVAELQRLFVPLYLFHRYQLEAAVKLIAGVDYHYAIKGQKPPVESHFVSAEKQQKALTAVLKTIDIKTLDIENKLADLLLPLAAGDSRDRELIETRSGVTFDIASAVESAADLTLSLLLHPHRMNRLSEQHARQKDIMSVSDVLQQLSKATWQNNHRQTKKQWLQDSVNWVTLQNLLQLSQHPQTAPQVKARVDAFLHKYAAQKHRHSMTQLIADEINRYFKGQWSPDKKEKPELPPGSPIGTGILIH